MDTKKQQFRVKPIAAAVGLAMVVPFMIGTALAAAPANVPVNGRVARLRRPPVSAPLAPLAVRQQLP